jgi:accessory colonization factor AcfC
MITSKSGAGETILAIQALVPGSRVAIQALEDDAEIPKWCAWLTWPGRHDIIVGASTMVDALKALREAVENAMRSDAF